MQMNNFEPLKPACLLRDEHGTHWNGQYGDVYHARQGALAQAQHVFLRGNGLPQRWQGREAFTVCEAGFGLGRNFLALWQAWRDDPERCPRLHVLAFEAHPFTREDLRQANRDLPAFLQPLAGQLAQNWPLLLPGLHRLEFESGALTLTLAFGQIGRMIHQTQASVDAFFLDGFAPRLNPQMWTPEVFGQMVRMAGAGATLATWCVAGQVRRDLSAAGFLVSSAPGFGGKREMLVATLRPELGARQGAKQNGRILVVGAGIAGASIAHALAQRGNDVTVFDPALKNGLGAAHAGHRAIAVTPVLSVDDNPRARLVRAGVLRALHRWQALPEPARPRCCGAFVMPKNEAQAARLQVVLERLQFPPEWASWQAPQDISARLGWQPPRSGLWFEQAQVVQPELLLQALLTHPNIHTRALGVQRLNVDAGQNWQAIHTDGSTSSDWQTVILANAHGAYPLLKNSVRTSRDIEQIYPKLAAARRTGGQVSYYAAHPQLPAARATLSGEGYWLPEIDGCHTTGSTYWHDLQTVQTTAAGHTAIRDKLKTFLPVDEHDLAWQNNGGWAGWRSVITGRLPIIGAVDGAALNMEANAPLWLACAFGSRGFTWASLAADHITATLYGEPRLLERELLASIAPR